jgi:soluble lytic murein transglycosylase
VNKHKKIVVWVSVALGMFLVISILLSSLHFFLGPDENEYDEVIWSTAQKYHLDPLLIKAIIKRESRFKYYIRGGKGEIGLMQLMPGVIQDWERIHHKKVDEVEIFLPSLNIEIGTWYFHNAYVKWANSKYQLSYALAEYNAGGGNLRKWIKKYGTVAPESVIQFPSTVDYVKTIIGYYNDYREASGLQKYLETDLNQARVDLKHKKKESSVVGCAKQAEGK